MCVSSVFISVRPTTSPAHTAPLPKAREYTVTETVSECPLRPVTAHAALPEDHVEWAARGSTLLSLYFCPLPRTADHKNSPHQSFIGFLDIPLVFSSFCFPFRVFCFSYFTENCCTRFFTLSIDVLQCYQSGFLIFRLISYMFFLSYFLFFSYFT